MPMSAAHQNTHTGSAVAAQDDDCDCCNGSSCAYAVPVSGRVHPNAAPTDAELSASPLCCGASGTRSSGADPVPKPPSLTELSLLRI
ncbi:hypothetical protein [Actinospica robiniae]|uniref:hypothetical protein n=1 Tax=Actinospica robiniae TaxID=304901 RepID=UPI000554E458|nr:hypothetical protein [Actinospica robiniae]